MGVRDLTLVAQEAMRPGAAPGRAKRRGPRHGAVESLAGSQEKRVSRGLVRADPPLRDYLTAAEVERLLAAARSSPRHGLRNYAMLLIAYRHALRASELTHLKLSDIDFAARGIYCRRLKGSVSNVHPLAQDELKVLAELRDCRPGAAGDHVFVSERGGPMTRYGIWHVVREAGAGAGLGREIHPHMLKHAAGYYFANKGLDVRLIQEYMSHVQIMNTIRYTRVDARRFAGMWA